MTPVEPTALHDGGRLVIFAKALFLGGRIRIWLHTFNRPLQPIRVEVAEPECGMGES